MKCLKTENSMLVFSVMMQNQIKKLVCCVQKYNTEHKNKE